MVDIHGIFPLFYEDAGDPKNYRFKRTDDYIAPIIKNKSEIIYRLGESIEHKTQYFIYPPKDFEKWADICVHIIRHYNEGWNNGFHYNIKYWEIWNEPDSKLMWLGTPQQYFKLYEVAARAIKQYDPSLQVGGPAPANLKGEFVRNFLAYCRDKSLPLDFFSWHLYTDDPKEIVSYAKYARKLLDEYGFTNTRIFLDEWHYKNVQWRTIFPGNMNKDTELPGSDVSKYKKVKDAFAEVNGPKGAAFAASVLILLQDAPVDVATYYSADYIINFSMFDHFGIPGKVYYVFKAYNQLMKLRNRVTCTYIDYSTNNPAPLLAALSEDKKKAAILVSNTSTDQKSLDVSLKSFPGSKEIQVDIYTVDQKHNLDLTESKEINTGVSVLRLDLSPSSVYLLKLSGG